MKKSMISKEERFMQVVLIAGAMMYAFVLGLVTVPTHTVRVMVTETKYVEVPVEVPAGQSLGGSLEIPTVKALFESTLASNITSSASTFTLTSALDKEGNTLASSTYPFIIDEGTANEEMVIADCTGTTCTNVTRGISVLSGTTSITSLQKSHRRGATVKITDGPQLLILTRIMNGIGTFPNIIRYTSHPTFAGLTDLVDKKYVDDTAFSGAAVIDATTLARGVGELATGCEAASSTASGGSGVLLIPAQLATSTWNSVTLAGCKVIVANNLGKIDSNFVSTTTLFSSSFTAGTTTISGSLTLTGGNSTSNIASSSIQAFTASTSPTTTWTKPANLKYIEVEVIGGGGNGASASAGGGCANESGGGGGGGYSREIIPASALGTTETVQVGGGGAWGSGDGGTSAFGSFLSATGGSANDGSGNNTPGGTGSGGDINIAGQGAGAPGDAGGGGIGGSSHMGGGGGGGHCGTGGNGGSYGGGGGGGSTTSGGSGSNGGTGATGAVIVRQYFY